LIRTVTNNTSAALDIGIQVLVGTGPDCSGHFASELCLTEIDQQSASFIVGSDGCHPIPAFASCDITLRFDPTAVYAMTGAIELSAPGNPAVRELQWHITGTGIPTQTNAMTVLAIEYFNAASNHYFITAAPLEISALDDGLFAGWQRSGRSFWVLPPDYSGPEASAPVCRYYGRPEAGLDSHFYSAFPSECAEVAARFPDAWQLESEDVFRVGLPDASSGACATGMPVYRLYDNHPDADHRYTIDAQVRKNMIAAGWVSEGYGADGVAMCAP
jgi:hypothetical protein